ncbi:MAG: FAD-dependent oxidoreductase, partial [Methanosarcinales archaeon]|nr:FAD-dependent oxidoreductase [Methanosarcinales archaeon]
MAAHNGGGPGIAPCAACSLEETASGGRGMECPASVPLQGPGPLDGGDHGIGSTGKRVAVVGSGPGGLTCAADLARLGHEVVLFEALHLPGGVLAYGIPEFRLPREILRREVDYIRSLGVEVRLDSVVSRLYQVKELQEEFDAVFLAIGAGGPIFLDIPGKDLNGVYSANEYLTRINLMEAHQFPRKDTPVIQG